jgi:hypothetical protein
LPCCLCSPPHPDEDMLSIAKIRTRGNTIRGGYYAPFGLHHETDGRPYRASTVLICELSDDDGMAEQLAQQQHDIIPISAEIYIPVPARWW